MGGQNSVRIPESPIVSLLLVALGPLSTDVMYLPLLPSMALDLEAGAGAVQFTLRVFLFGIAMPAMIAALGIGTLAVVLYLPTES